MFWQAAAYVELRSTCGVWAVWFQVYLKPISKCLNISQSIHIYNQIIQTYPKHFGVTASHSWTNSSHSHVLISLSLSLTTYMHASLLTWLKPLACGVLISIFLSMLFEHGNKASAQDKACLLKVIIWALFGPCCALNARVSFWQIGRWFE